MNPFEGYSIAPADPDAREQFEKDFLKELNQEYTPLDKVDYHIGNRPLSFAQIRSVAEGEEWYRQHHPEVPDDILKIMARHQFGEQEAKTPAKPKTPVKKQGITIERKDIIVEF